MSGAFRRGAAIALLGAAACAPLIGLDDLRARPSEIEEDSGADAGDVDVPVDANGSACTSNADCIDEASVVPAVCVAKQCKRIDTDLCLPQVLPSIDALRSESAVLFAAFIPIDVPAPLSFGYSLAYTLALEEIDKAGGISVEPRRDVAMVFCASEPDKVERAVHHVVDDLRVPAMIANFTPGDMVKFVKDVALPNEVFTLNPSVAPEAIKYGNVDRLVWNLLGTAEDVALAYRPLVERTEKYARGASGPFFDPDAGVGVAGDLRVALLAIDQPLETSMDTVIRRGAFIPTGDAGGSYDPDKAIRFNDASIADNGAKFQRIPVPALESVGPASYDAVVDKLAALEPHVIIALTWREVEAIVPAVEARLADAGAPAPVWLLAPRNARSVTGYLADGGAFDEKKRRFLGIQYAGATDVAQRDVWLEGMRVAYPGVEEARYASSENFYDAVYWLTYGLAAAGPGAPTSGASIREGIRRLVSGPVVHPGNIESISYAFRTIGFGDVTFVGALGPPDIHTGFGTWNSVGSAYCYVNESGTIVPKYDGYRYDEDAGKLDDVNPCLFGF